MANIFQMTFSNALPSMKIVVFWFKFHLKVVPNGPINNNQEHCFRKWLGASLAPSHYLDQWWPQWVKTYPYGAGSSTLWMSMGYKKKIQHQLFSSVSAKWFWLMFNIFYEMGFNTGHSVFTLALHGQLWLMCCSSYLTLAEFLVFLTLLQY